jgi:hypothetical protein
MYDDELQRITFSSTTFNNSVDVSVGGDRDLNLEEILKSFRGFLVASGFDYVAHIEAGYHNGDYVSTKEEEDYIDEEDLQFNKPNTLNISKSDYEKAVTMSGDAEPF